MLTQDATNARQFLDDKHLLTLSSYMSLSSWLLSCLHRNSTKTRQYYFHCVKPLLLVLRHMRKGCILLIVALWSQVYHIKFITYQYCHLCKGRFTTVGEAFSEMQVNRITEHYYGLGSHFPSLSCSVVGRTMLFCIGSQSVSEWLSFSLSLGTLNASDQILMWQSASLWRKIYAYKMYKSALVHFFYMNLHMCIHTQAEATQTTKLRHWRHSSTDMKEESIVKTLSMFL